ncbi:MAG TPA: Glu-tRNA(Gln) amidotransferase GatDE subunit E, partial [Candidatus Nanoarchaeia archaeon]|nr:Glu-tRNA(Gln) amidotransferase GatDE subunit E [Candidatus Nanoarchaeia archaeon]
MDYKALGLKCGLEIHQQLDTSKLFCSSPSVLRDDNPLFFVKRCLHAVQGESGQVDVAALHEQRKGNEF